MRKLWWWVLAWCLSGCAAGIATDYKGPDSGQVVVGIGVRGYTKFEGISLLFRRVGQPASTGFLTYRYRGTFGGERADYKFETHEERGVTMVASLPPGDYEVYNVNFYWAPGSFSFKQPMVLPFTVKPGEAVYLGNYQFTELSGKNMLRFSVPTGGFFAVEDRMATELPLALNKGLSPRAKVVNATPDPAQVRHPLLLTPAERQRVAAELRLEE